MESKKFAKDPPPPRYPHTHAFAAVALVTAVYQNGEVQHLFAYKTHSRAEISVHNN